MQETARLVSRDPALGRYYELVAELQQRHGQALDVGALSLFAVAVTAGPLSVVGAVGSLYPVVTILLAAFLLRERLGTWQRLGTLGALAGVALISAG